MKITNKLFPDKKFGIVDLFAYIKGEFAMLHSRLDNLDKLIKGKIDIEKSPLRKPYSAQQLEDEKNAEEDKRKYT